MRSREMIQSKSIPQGTSDGDVGCLICRQAVEGMEEFLIWLRAEGQGDQAIRAHLAGTYGFCQRHSWQLVRVGEVDHLSVLYQHLLQKTIERLEAAHQVLNRPIRGLPAKISRRRRSSAVMDLLRPRGSCPACEHQEAAVGEAIRSLVKAVPTHRTRGEGSALPPLCMPHFFQAVGSADAAAAQVLLQAQRRTLQKLAEDLGEYSRKLDYRFRDEPKGGEQTAWLVAIRLFTGQRIEPSRAPLDWRRIIRARHRSGNLGFGIPEALEQPGCPICRLVVGRTEQFFFWFLAESYHFPEVIEKLQRSFGFCPAHAQRLVDYGEHSTVAFVYELLIQGALQRINDLTVQGSRSGFGLKKGGWRQGRRVFLPDGPCLACERVAEGTEANVFWLFDALRTTKGRERYRRSDGLCLIHFLKAFEKASEEGVLLELLEDQRGRLQRLLTAFEAALVGRVASGGGVEPSILQNIVERFVGPKL